MWPEAFANVAPEPTHLPADELRQRGVLEGPRPEPTEFALMLVKSFVHFPRIAASA